MRHISAQTRSRVLRAAACTLLLSPFLGAAACGGGSSDNPTPATTVTETESAPAEDTGTSSEEGDLPDMTGKILQDAQDEAQANGFYSLDSTDATGAGRYQVLDRNWVVCSQSPEPGQQSTDVTVTFNTVKSGEDCP
ncbi:PASTA domain-containing protein [Streptomyces sp. NPDC102406]|uniref:PASTA domain-containing protein n=1 Tax=Streptomyces sp. NPDC102406 TaxID=3366171 RepID=UPI00380BF35A